MTSRAYSHAVGYLEESESTLPEPNLELVQERINWLNSSVTAKLVKDLSSYAEELELQARNSACCYHQHTNHQNVIQLLVRAAEIRKVINAYIKESGGR